MEHRKNNLNSAVRITGKACPTADLESSCSKPEQRKSQQFTPKCPGRYHQPRPRVLHGAKSQKRHLLGHPPKSKYSPVVCNITGASRKSWKRITWQSHFVQQTPPFCPSTRTAFIFQDMEKPHCTHRPLASVLELPRGTHTTMNYLGSHNTCKAPRQSWSRCAESAAILQQKSSLHRLDGAGKHQRGCK